MESESTNFKNETERRHTDVEEKMIQNGTPGNPETRLTEYEEKN